jgi:uncharacterized cupin superfamily protein
MTTTEMHHSDSVDFSIVLEGTVDLILDDGTHRLGPGDGVVMNGVDHAWATHEEQRGRSKHRAQRHRSSATPRAINVTAAATRRSTR